MLILPNRLHGLRVWVCVECDFSLSLELRFWLLRAFRSFSVGATGFSAFCFASARVSFLLPLSLSHSLLSSPLRSLALASIFFAKEREREKWGRKLKKTRMFQKPNRHARSCTAEHTHAKPKGSGQVGNCANKSKLSFPEHLVWNWRAYVIEFPLRDLREGGRNGPRNRGSLIWAAKRGPKMLWYGSAFFLSSLLRICADFFKMVDWNGLVSLRR